MAREQGSCWRCGAEWANEPAPAVALRASRELELPVDAEPAFALRAVAASG